VSRRGRRMGVWMPGVVVEERVQKRKKKKRVQKT
jgi:hypothetical protein